MKIAVDENILIKGEICAAGSKMLHNFKAPYSATVVEKITEAEIMIAYRSKTGEFGVETSQKETAAYLVGSGAVDAALGIDVDGAAYRSAAKNNVAYIKPTYGTVSRFGLVANVSSVDQIGVYAKNLDDGFYVLSKIAGHDTNDGASYPAEKYEYSDKEIDLPALKSINSPDLKFKEYLKPVYMIISAAEFSGNIARFDGLKFGYRAENCKNLDDMIINSRSEAFTAETKLKTLMGTYVLSKEQFEKYYYKAMQIRRLVKQELDELFERYDIVILPPCDKAVALANLSGCPAVVFDGKLAIAKQFNENKLFAIGRSHICNTKL